VVEQSESGAGESRDAVLTAGLGDLPGSDGTAWFGDVRDTMAASVIYIVAERQETI
jgi:hypothetical protein